MPARKLQFTLTIPAWLDSVFRAVLLLARRLPCEAAPSAFCKIPLTQGKFALVDPDDYPRLNIYKWHAIKKGNRFYASRWETVNGKRIHVYMHRQIMAHHLSAACPAPSPLPIFNVQSSIFNSLNPVPCPLYPDLFVDHIDRNPLNNQKSNLRLATRTQNNWNSERGKNCGASKYKGVSWRPKKRKWQAIFYINNRSKSLGYFTDEIAAAKAYDRAARQHRGDFAVLNFP